LHGVVVLSGLMQGNAQQVQGVGVGWRCLQHLPIERRGLIVSPGAVVLESRLENAIHVGGRLREQMGMGAVLTEYAKRRIISAVSGSGSLCGDGVSRDKLHFGTSRVQAATLALR
jgi:hypothetical protein